MLAIRLRPKLRLPVIGTFLVVAAAAVAPLA
jgi:hypothetical protein